jgi:D-sedoheptulose 7-phosphate isomerase
MMQTWLQEYVAAQHRALDSLPLDSVAAATQMVREAWLADGQIFAIGNGGSAANCSHFSTDLGKCSADATGHPFRVLSLTDNTAFITALGNDYAYEDVYLRQLKNLGQAGDVIIAVSVSGNSPNLVKAFTWAKERGMRTIAIVGGKRGRLAEISDLTIAIGETHYGRAEDVQMHVLHMICYAFVELPDMQKR